MVFNKKKIPLTTIVGIIGILFYCILVFISAFLCIGSWNPIDNYLSDFGNSSSSWNPNGAIFFDLALIILGTTLILYYISLYKWSGELKTEYNENILNITQFIGFLVGIFLILFGFSYNLKYTFYGFPLLIFYSIGLCMRAENLKKIWNKSALIFTQIIGSLSGIFVITAGIFPTVITEAHDLASALFFNTHLFTFILLVLTILPHKKFIKIIGLYGWIVACLIFLDLVYHKPIFEWISVFSSLSFMGLLSYNTYKAFSE